MLAGSVRCGQNTERQCRGREGLASYSIGLEFSVVVCHCHQDLLDAVDVNVLKKNFVGRSTVRITCLEAPEY